MFFSYVKNKNEVTDLSRGEESRIFRPVFFSGWQKKVDFWVNKKRDEKHILMGSIRGSFNLEELFAYHGISPPSDPPPLGKIFLLELFPSIEQANLRKWW